MRPRFRNAFITFVPPLLLAGCAGTEIGAESPAPEPSPPAPVTDSPQVMEPAVEWVAVFPGVRINRAIRAVEFEGTVPLDAHNPETPDVYLEVLVCIPDSKEHESLVVTDAKPSHIHASLLLLGYEPGEPGVWSWSDGRAVLTPPTGSALDVRFIVGSRDERATDWIMAINDEVTSNLIAPDQPGWRFAGSKLRDFRGERVYDADRRGVLVGLHTFGGETVGLTRVMSPEASNEEPIWLANPERVPDYGTPVTVRLMAWPDDE
ncbi:MAG: YdjY domain-containing protein [Planctomycetota bacterium]